MEQTAINWLIEQLKEYDFADVHDNENYIIKIPAWILTKKEEEAREIETKKLFDISLEAMNLGMEIRQNQLSGNSEKSGKEYHKEWFDNLKTKND